MSRNSPFALLWPLAYTTAYSAAPTVSFKNEWQAMNSSCRPRLTRACAAHALSRYRLINATHAYNSSLSHQFQYQWIWSTIIMAVFYVPTGLYLRENGSLYGPTSTVLYVYGLSAIMNQLQASHNGPLHCVAKGVHGCSLFYHKRPRKLRVQRIDCILSVYVRSSVIINWREWSTMDTKNRSNVWTGQNGHIFDINKWRRGAQSETFIVKRESAWCYSRLRNCVC